MQKRILSHRRCKVITVERGKYMLWPAAAAAAGADVCDCTIQSTKKCQKPWEMHDCRNPRDLTDQQINSAIQLEIWRCIFANISCEYLATKSRSVKFRIKIPLSVNGDIGAHWFDPLTRANVSQKFLYIDGGS